MNSPMRLCRHSVVVIAAAFFFVACSHHATGHRSIMLDPPGSDRSILVGEWDYEDGGTVVLRLDEQGNGTYAFKDGRFETHHFDGQTWSGKWYQRENDRDGGFQITLSADRSEGEGTWWYDRIGADTSPSEKGGTFHVSRKTSVTRLSETPPPP